MRPVDPSTQVLINAIVEECMTCSSCSQKMSQSARHLPKSLDCSHTFCTSCMEKCKTGMGIFSSIACPTCNVETTVGIMGVSGLKNNHTILSLINILEVFSAVTCDSCYVNPATLRCLTCPDKRSLCESCHSDPGGPHALHDVREVALQTDASLTRTGLSSTPRASSLDPTSSDTEEIQTSLIECPRSVVGRLVSAQGDSFDNIRAQTFCNIEFRRLSDRHAPALISIHGPNNKVHQARTMIDQVVKEILKSDSLRDENHSGHKSFSDRQTGWASGLDDDMNLDISHYEAIVLFELRYDDVMRIARNTSTSINLLHHTKTHSHTVVIRPQGSAAQLDKAHEGITRMLDSSPVKDSEREGTRRRMSTDHFGSTQEVTETMMLPKVQYHKLVSSAYMILNKIALRVGCRIDITEESETGMGIVTFRGNRLEVAEAQDLLRRAFDRRPHTFTTTATPPGFHTTDGLASVQGERIARSTQAEASSPFSSHGPCTNRPPLLLHNTPDEQRRRYHSFTTPRLTPSTPESSLNSESNTPASGGHGHATRMTPVRQGPVSAFIDCDYDSIGKLIGVKGSRMEELRSLTDCSLSVLKGRNSSLCRVEVRGWHDKVSTAVPLLKMVLGSGELAMSKIRSMHYSLEIQAKESCGDQQDVMSKSLTDHMHSSYRYSDDGTALLSDRLTQALRFPTERADEGGLSTSSDRDQGKHRSNEGTPTTSDMTHPREKNPCNRSVSIAQSPVCEARTCRSHSSFSRQYSSNDEGRNKSALVPSSPDTSGSISTSSHFGASPGVLRSSTSCYESGSETDEEHSKDGNGCTSRSVDSRTKYTISPPSSPSPSGLYPEYFFQPHLSMRNEAMFQCEGDSTLLNEHVLDDISTKTRCQITLEHGNPNQPLVLRLKGQADERELAKFLITAVLRPPYHWSPERPIHYDGLDGIIRTMNCHPHFIPVVIGTGGSTIENIQSQTATKILINENTNQDCPPAISIIGSVAGVEIAVSMLDRLVMNHRFKYLQQPLTAESRARSLPVQSVSPMRAANYSRESSDGDDDDIFDHDEEGGRNVMMQTPPPPRQRKCEAGSSVQSRPVFSTSKDTPPSCGAEKQPAQSSVFLRSLRQQPSVTSIPSFSSLSASSTGGDSSCLSPLSFLRCNSQSSRSGSYLTRSSSFSASFECLPSSADTEDAPEESIHVPIHCQVDKVAQVIGKRGSILRELKRLSGCDIVVDQTNSPVARLGNKFSSKCHPPVRISSAAPFSERPEGSNSFIVSDTSRGDSQQSITPELQIIWIIGTPKAVDEAIKLINTVIEVGPYVALGMRTDVMDCPLDKVPLVIGVKGLTAKEMMRRTGCKIHVNEDTQREGGTMCTIELTGTEEQLDQAKKLITHVLEHGTKALGKRFQRGKKEDGDDSTPT